VLGIESESGVAFEFDFNGGHERSPLLPAADTAI
jgi:hypothetical protein